MPFRDYVTALQGLLATTPFVTATSLAYEERPPAAGLLAAEHPSLHQVLQEIVSQLALP
jgi:hypothetical protein